MMQGGFRADLETDFDVIQDHIRRQAIRETLFHIAAPEPQHLGIDPVWFVERRRIIQVTDNTQFTSQATGRDDIHIRIRDNRHRYFHGRIFYLLLGR